MPEIRIMFVIGIPARSADDLGNIDVNVQKEIENEFENFGDILQVRKNKGVSGFQIL